MPSRLRDRFTNREKQLAIFQSRWTRRKDLFRRSCSTGWAWKKLADCQATRVALKPFGSASGSHRLHDGAWQQSLSWRFRRCSAGSASPHRQPLPQFDLALAVVQFRRHRIDEGAMYRAANQSAGEFWSWAKTTLDALISAAFSFVIAGVAFADNPAVQDTKARLFPEVAGS